MVARALPVPNSQIQGKYRPRSCMIFVSQNRNRACDLMPTPLDGIPLAHPCSPPPLSCTLACTYSGCYSCLYAQQYDKIQAPDLCLSAPPRPKPPPPPVNLLSLCRQVGAKDTEFFIQTTQTYLKAAG